MLTRVVEAEPPRARWYEGALLHILLPGGMFLSLSPRCLELAGYRPNAVQALEQLIAEGSAKMIELPVERGGYGPLLMLTFEEANALRGFGTLPAGHGLKPIVIPEDRWGHA